MEACSERAVDLCSGSAHTHTLDKNTVQTVKDHLYTWVAPGHSEVEIVRPQLGDGKRDEPLRQRQPGEEGLGIVGGTLP